MSSESELTRDKDGFLKCKDCPRRFVTEIMFENHSSNPHKKETETKLIDAVHKKLTTDQCKECKKSFRPSNHLKRHIDNVHKKLTPYQCKECKKSYGQKKNLKIHINSIHKNLNPHQYQD